MQRRSVLSGLAAATAVGLTGCLDSPQTTETPQHHLEVTVQNNHDRPYEVRVVLTESNDDVVHDDEFSVAPGEGRGFSNDYPDGTYRLEVSLSDRGPLRSHWDTTLCDIHQVLMDIDSEGYVSSTVRCAERTTSLS